MHFYYKLILQAITLLELKDLDPRVGGQIIPSVVALREGLGVSLHEGKLIVDGLKAAVDLRATEDKARFVYGYIAASLFKQALRSTDTNEVGGARAGL